MTRLAACMKSRDCESCARPVPLPRFSRQKWCPPCSQRERAELNRIRARGHYWRDPEAARAARSRYREEHRTELRAYQRAYRLAHPEQARRWKSANPERVKEHDRRIYERHREKRFALSQARRAAKSSAVVERVFRSVLWRQHKGICGICRRPVSVQAMDVDHIIPLVLGGVHSYANTQPAHGKCNRQKGGRLVAVQKGQLSLQSERQR